MEEPLPSHLPPLPPLTSTEDADHWLSTLVQPYDDAIMQPANGLSPPSPTSPPLPSDAPQRHQCQFEGCELSYATPHARRQHYRKAHPEEWAKVRLPLGKLSLAIWREQANMRRASTCSSGYSTTAEDELETGGGPANISYGASSLAVNPDELPPIWTPPTSTATSYSSPLQAHEHVTEHSVPSPLYQHTLDAAVADLQKQLSTDVLTSPRVSPAPVDTSSLDSMQTAPSASYSMLPSLASLYSSAVEPIQSTSFDTYFGMNGLATPLHGSEFTTGQPLHGCSMDSFGTPIGSSRDLMSMLTPVPCFDSFSLTSDHYSVATPQPLTAMGLLAELPDIDQFNEACPAANPLPDPQPLTGFKLHLQDLTSMHTDLLAASALPTHAPSPLSQCYSPKAVRTHRRLSALERQWSAPGCRDTTQHSSRLPSAHKIHGDAIRSATSSPLGMSWQSNNNSSPDIYCNSDGLTGFTLDTVPTAAQRLADTQPPVYHREPRALSWPYTLDTGGLYLSRLATPSQPSPPHRMSASYPSLPGFSSCASTELQLNDSGRLPTIPSRSNSLAETPTDTRMAHPYPALDATPPASASFDYLSSAQHFPALRLPALRPASASLDNDSGLTAPWLLTSSFDQQSQCLQDLSMDSFGAHAQGNDMDIGYAFPSSQASTPSVGDMDWGMATPGVSLSSPYPLHMAADFSSEPDLGQYYGTPAAATLQATSFATSLAISTPLYDHHASCSPTQTTTTQATSSEVWRSLALHNY